jgi:hypothetical protein
MLCSLGAVTPLCSGYRSSAPRTGGSASISIIDEKAVRRIGHLDDIGGSHLANTGNVSENPAVEFDDRAAVCPLVTSRPSAPGFQGSPTERLDMSGRHIGISSPSDLASSWLRAIDQRAQRLHTAGNNRDHSRCAGLTMKLIRLPLKPSPLRRRVTVGGSAEASAARPRPHVYLQRKTKKIHRT